MRKEAKHQILWSKYVQNQNKKGKYFYYELKQTRVDYFPFDSFEEQQIPSLLALQNNGFCYKMSDADTRLKPCDGMSLPPLPSYVVVKYPKAFIMISINNFIHTRDTNKRKSLTYEKALSIAHKVIHS